MRISRKSDYALRAIFHLAGVEPGKPVSVREVASQNDVPRRFLENIMVEMKDAGWVKSIPGRDGGYSLAKSPKDITIGEIVRRFDGVLSPIGCVSVSNYVPCSQECRCSFRRVLLEIRNYTVRLMEGANISAIMSGQVVTNDEVFSDELIDGLGI